MATTLLPRPRTLMAARATGEPFLVQVLLTAIAVGFLVLFLVLPLLTVFVQAFEKGTVAYFAALTEPMAVSALKLTLLTAGVAVPPLRSVRSPSTSSLGQSDRLAMVRFLIFAPSR